MASMSANACLQQLITTIDFTVAFFVEESRVISLFPSKLFFGLAGLTADLKLLTSRK
jgi:hypothetical protein